MDNFWIIEKQTLGLFSFHTNYTLVTPMLHIKKTLKKRQSKRGNPLLTKRDLTEIRKTLPLNWRKKIAEKHDGLTLRQITEVFNQRTKNAGHNVQVWTAINEVLSSAKQYSLVKKVERVISFYGLLDNVIQK